MSILFPLLAVLIWSISAIVNKLAVTTIDPAAISFYRWLLALIILTPIVLPGVIGNRQAVRVNGWKLLVLGLLGMVLYQSLAYYAAHSVCALFMGIIASLIPLLTILISLALLRSAPTVDVVLGSVLSFSGMIWLVSAGQPGALLQQGIGKGELMMLAATFSYALYGVLTKRWNIALPNWQSLYVQILFAVVLLLPEFLLAQDIRLDSHNIPMVLFAGIPASIIAPFLWVQGVMRLGANTAAIFMNLTPVFTAIIAVLFLHEQLHSYHLLGGGITLLGVILSQCLPTSWGQRAKIPTTGGHSARIRTTVENAPASCCAPPIAPRPGQKNAIFPLPTFHLPRIALSVAPFYSTKGCFMTNTFTKGLLLSSVITLLSACNKPQSRPQIDINGKTMGTFYSVKVSGDIAISKEQLQHQIDALLEQANDDISTYRANSVLSRFNHSRSTNPQAIPRGMANIILMAQRIGQDTGGAMDITIGPLVNLWGFGPDKRPVKVPTQQQIAAAQKKVGLQHLNLFSDSRGEWLQKDLPGMYVDLSTLGEGYGTDELVRLMTRNGITNYLVSVGGAVSAHGVNSQGKPWRVAIQKPTDRENAVQALVDLQGYSISTAGSYRNYFELDGQHYSHIIDPSTGKPIQHRLVSATVIASTALEADGWDTGLMVLDTEKALQLAQEKGLAAYLISKTNDGFSTVMTPQFKAFLVQ